ncbi:hypothetical protein [Piscinibacter sp. XHJ-5]|uniref:hypothetical protein n=1 Tax=Piscinibacter sp. XHJ-5 TaxID=3037797 RepID=UPI002452BD4C|nr:hypothetical protein [Piscinibacter sp. XHJ-5]
MSIEPNQDTAVRAMKQMALPGPVLLMLASESLLQGCGIPGVVYWVAFRVGVLCSLTFCPRRFPRGEDAEHAKMSLHRSISGGVCQGPPNLSIERTSSRKLRLRPAAAHVKR